MIEHNMENCMETLGPVHRDAVRFRGLYPNHGESTEKMENSMETGICRAHTIFPGMIAGLSLTARQRRDFLPTERSKSQVPKIRDPEL